MPKSLLFIFFIFFVGLKHTVSTDLLLFDGLRSFFLIMVSMVINAMGLS